MTAIDDFETLSAALEASCRAAPGVTGLVLLGSAAEGSRRDEWSDHDFFVLLHPDALDRREEFSWFPESDRIVLTAREGEIGRAVLYDDGHLMEFAAATEAELAEARINRHRIAYDSDGSVARLVERAVQRREPGADATAENNARLFLVKILVGVGRVRRGEALSGGQFVRTHAVNHLVRAIRAQLPGRMPDAQDDLDPLRRFELDYPELGTRLDAALAQPAEDAARALMSLARDALEPGWPDFPTRAADAVARRLGWVVDD